MNWFLIALIAPATWSISNHIDKYLLSKYFKAKSPAVMIIFSSLVGLLIAPLILVFRPDVIGLPFSTAWVFMLSGLLYVLAVIPYLFALENDDTSLVVPLFQTIPVLSYLFGFIFLHETLTANQIFASVLIILSSIGIAIDFSTQKIGFKFKVFWLMLIASIMFSLDTVLFKVAGVTSDFWTGAFWKYVGFLIPAILMLIFIKRYRNEFFDVWKNNQVKVTSINVANEVINTTAVLAMNFAILIAPLALVWVVNGFQPFFVFLYGLILTIFFPKIVKENITKRVLIHKIFFIILMFIGSYLLQI